MDTWVNVSPIARRNLLNRPIWKPRENIRSQYLRLPYGDQGLFVRAQAFREIGGFAEIPLMEDFDLVRRLRRHGRIEIAPAPALTSARRWLRLGPWRTTLINQGAVAAYRLGVSPERIAKCYYRD